MNEAIKIAAEPNAAQRIRVFKLPSPYQLNRACSPRLHRKEAPLEDSRQWFPSFGHHFGRGVSTAGSTVLPSAAIRVRRA